VVGTCEPPPTLYASGGHHRSVVETFVPVNDDHGGIFARSANRANFIEPRPDDDTVYLCGVRSPRRPFARHCPRCAKSDSRWPLIFARPNVGFGKRANLQNTTGYPPIPGPRCDSEFRCRYTPLFGVRFNRRSGKNSPAWRTPIALGARPTGKKRVERTKRCPIPDGPRESSGLRSRLGEATP